MCAPLEWEARAGVLNYSSDPNFSGILHSVLTTLRPLKAWTCTQRLLQLPPVQWPGALLEPLSRYWLGLLFGLLCSFPFYFDISSLGCS